MVCGITKQRMSPSLHPPCSSILLTLLPEALMSLFLDSTYQKYLTCCSLHVDTEVRISYQVDVMWLGKVGSHLTSYANECLS